MGLSYCFGDYASNQSYFLFSVMFSIVYSVPSCCCLFIYCLFVGFCLVFCLFDFIWCLFDCFDCCHFSFLFLFRLTFYILFSVLYSNLYLVSVLCCYFVQFSIPY